MWGVQLLFVDDLARLGVGGKGALVALLLILQLFLGAVSLGSEGLLLVVELDVPLRGVAVFDGVRLGKICGLGVWIAGDLLLVGQLPHFGGRVVSVDFRAEGALEQLLVLHEVFALLVQLFLGFSLLDGEVDVAHALRLLVVRANEVSHFFSVVSGHLLRSEVVRGHRSLIHPHLLADVLDGFILASDLHLPVEQVLLLDVLALPHLSLEVQLVEVEQVKVVLNQFDVSRLQQQVPHGVKLPLLQGLLPQLHVILHLDIEFMLSLHHHQLLSPLRFLAIRRTVLGFPELLLLLLMEVHLPRDLVEGLLLLLSLWRIHLHFELGGVVKLLVPLRDGLALEQV